MICPKCRNEFKDGIFRCSDCDIDLVSALPDDTEDCVPEYDELVAVFESQDQSQLLVAKSVLDSANIKFYATGEQAQNLFGMGVLGTGFNIIVGPVVIKVEKEDAEDAKRMLSELNKDNTDDPK